MKSSFFGLLAALASSALLAATPTPSPSGTVILAGSVTTITDAAGNVWGISPNAPCTAVWAPAGTKSEVTLNGALQATSCMVTELAYVNGVIWQENTASNWYSWNGTAWVAGANPLPPPSQALLTWTAPTLDTNGAAITVPLTYNVYRGPTAAALTKLTNVTGVTYTDPAGSSTPTQYCYAVTAVQAGQESAQSDVACVTIQAPILVPGSPTLSVTAH